MNFHFQFIRLPTTFKIPFRAIKILLLCPFCVLFTATQTVTRGFINLPDDNDHLHVEACKLVLQMFRVRLGK